MKNRSVQRLEAPTKGWNTVSPIKEMPPQFAPRMDNIYIDSPNSIRRRPAQIAVDTVNVVPFDSAVEYVNLAGVSFIYARGTDNKLYTSSGSGGWTATTETFANKIYASMLKGVIVIGDGMTVRAYNGTVWSTPTAINPMKYFTVYEGRMYGAGNSVQGTTVYYSDTIGGTGVGANDWTTGTGGFLDISGAIDGGDVITGLTTFQGNLVVFTNKSIVLYKGTDPNVAGNFTVAKVIEGIGCKSQSTIQPIGNDVIFLSNYGFKKLGQVIAKGDVAAADISNAINNFVVNQVRTGEAAEIYLSSAYMEELGVYLCRFANTTFAYHTTFDAWTAWYGIQTALISLSNGNSYTIGVRLCHIDSTQNGDRLDGGLNTSIPMVIDFLPARASDNESKTRWQGIELIYEGRIGEVVQISSWIGLSKDTIVTSNITLSSEL